MSAEEQLAGDGLTGWRRTSAEAPRVLHQDGEEEEVAPGITVAVCTFKRVWSLNRFLDSLAAQERKPDELVIVDASPDTDTEDALRKRKDIESLATLVVYLHVGEKHRGLTRQRNIALRWVSKELTAFFDDDIVLKAGCLAEMERVHTAFGKDVVGVGAVVVNGTQTPSLLWRFRLRVGIVRTLTPGSYQRSGMSIPWGFLGPTDNVVRGDYLPGGAVMWKTRIARIVGFEERFRGYGQGEDLDFSLRTRAYGTLVMAGSARLLHLHDDRGRPNHFLIGYMAIYNRYHIHRHGLDDRTCWDTLWFGYAWTMDTILMIRHLVFPARIAPTLKQVAGRFRAVVDLIVED